ncbi:MAG: Holliday junction branch migration DNA helicase RuvB [Planctomycetes bacterium]|nr:Holliday junction branch migration DNA helicase RuvB [Planctomycetota bacterium]
MIFHDPSRTEDQEFDRALRPATFADFVGQPEVRENLRVAIEAALGRGEPLDHVLFAGPPGLGKTTLAHLIAAGMNTAITVTSGPALASPKDLMGTLTRLQRGDVLFVDEIHRLPRTVEEYLYSAMEDHAIDVPLDQGPAGRTIRINLQPFTLVGATTREGLLSGPFRARFGLVERLEPYPESDIVLILARAARLLAFPIDAAAAELLATRSRGVPRTALRLQRRARDLAQVQGARAVSVALAEESLRRLRIDVLGLEEMDRRILRALIQRGEATGLKTLAAMVDEAEDTLEDVFEPHLLRIGLLVRTPRGRLATDKAYDHLGLPRGRGVAGDLPCPD